MYEIACRPDIAFYIRSFTFDAGWEYDQDLSPRGDIIFAVCFQNRLPTSLFRINYQAYIPCGMSLC